MCSHTFYMLKIVDGVVRHFETVTFGTAADDFLLPFLSRLRSRSETYKLFSGVVVVVVGGGVNFLCLGHFLRNYMG